MSDQAERLRQLAGAGDGATAGTGVLDRAALRERDQPAAAQPETARGDDRSISLAVHQRQGRRRDVEHRTEPGDRAGSTWAASVVVVDGDIGLANLDLLGGFYPRYDLGDVLLGRCELSEAVVPGPGGIQVVPGAHASRTS